MGRFIAKFGQFGYAAFGLDNFIPDLNVTPGSIQAMLLW